MKHLLAIVSIISVCTTQGQTSQPITLKWKIGEKEELKYLMKQEEIDTSVFMMDTIEFPIGLGDSGSTGWNKVLDLNKKLRQAQQHQTHIATLRSKPGDVVDIVVESRKEKSDDPVVKDSSKDSTDDFVKLAESFSGGVILRGSVFASGGIHSFWVKSDQKNLISLLFELPTRPVSIGDKWPLEISFIGNDQNFTCDTSFRKNEVTLTSIRNGTNGQVAMLRYDIDEYVRGDFSTGFMPTKKHDKGSTMIRVSYLGTAEFDVNNGRWIRFNGIMSLESTGFMTSKENTTFSLVKLEK